MKLTGAWGVALERVTQLKPRLDRNLAHAGEESGRAAVEAVRAGLQSQAPGGDRFAALHPWTVERKGDTTALAGGPMERAVTFRVEDDGLVLWVGVPDGATDRRGTSLAMIARAQEFGLVIDVTDRMRRYLHGQGFHLRPETQSIALPARPFLRPALRQVVPGIRVRYRDAVATALRGR